MVLKIVLTILSVVFFILTITTKSEIDFQYFLFILIYLIILTLLLKFFRTHQQIEYDGNLNLIVYKKNKMDVFKIALKDINQINSLILLNFKVNGISYEKYNIFYYDDNKELQKISFYAEPFTSEITTIINKISSINPNFKMDQFDWF